MSCSPPARTSRPHSLLSADSPTGSNAPTTGSYRAALSAYAELSSPSPTLSLYAARAHLALSPPDCASALSVLQSLEPSLDVRAISALANYLAGDKEAAMGELEELLAEVGEQGLEQDGEGEGRFVRGAVGTVWILEGDEQRREEGVEVLREAVELGHDQEWCVPLPAFSGLPQFAADEPRVPTLLAASACSLTCTSRYTSPRSRPRSSPPPRRPPSPPTRSSRSSSSRAPTSRPARPKSTKTRTMSLRRSRTCRAGAGRAY